jgi:hypothetical protein
MSWQECSYRKQLNHSDMLYFVLPMTLHSGRQGVFLHHHYISTLEPLMQEPKEQIKKRAIRTIVLIAPKDNPADYERLSAHS